MKYKIKKGRHFARFQMSRLWPFSGRCIQGDIIFGDTCWHRRDEINHTGWNKLVGISSFFIHRNSGRLVWQPDFNKPGYILIAAYIYSEGVRHSSTFTRIRVGERTPYSVFAQPNGKWFFSVGGSHIEMQGELPGFLHFKAFPYFGGRSKAPHDMVIELNRHKCFD